MALTTGVRQAATARTSDSSENGSRSSIDPAPHCGPAPGGVAEHVPFRGRIPSADQADLSGQEGQRALALGAEKTLRRQGAPQPLQPGEQLTDANGADLDRGQRK